MDQSLVKNASDRKQIKNADVKIELARERELNDLKTVLNTIEGRRVFWRLMGQLGLNQSVHVQNSGIYYKSGQQDAAHLILAEILAADEEFFFTMMRENRNKE